MSIASSEIWSRLVETGLADDASCRRYAAAFSKFIGGGSPDDADADAVAAFLVQAGALTPFQAKRLTRAERPDLRVGSFVMTSDQPVTPLVHWLPVQTPPARADQRPLHLDQPSTRRGFLLRVPLNQLTPSQRQWLALHSEIHADTLQPIELSGGAQSGQADQMVEIFSALPEGGSLLKVLKSASRLSRRKALRIGIDLAAALQTLHQNATPEGQPLAHGAVLADHVWVTAKGRAVLLRDPSSPPRCPHADWSAAWIQRSASPSPNAPELNHPAATPTPASDIYALGCLVFHLLSGRPLSQAAGEAGTGPAGQQGAALPPEVTEAVAAGPSGDPIFRVLAYALAKDPSARFPSAAAFGEALARAGEIALGKPVQDGSPGPVAEPMAEPPTPTPTPPPPPSNAPFEAGQAASQAGAHRTEVPTEAAAEAPAESQPNQQPVPPPAAKLAPKAAPEPQTPPATPAAAGGAEPPKPKEISEPQAAQAGTPGKPAVETEPRPAETPVQRAPPARHPDSNEATEGVSPAKPAPAPNAATPSAPAQRSAAPEVSASKSPSAVQVQVTPPPAPKLQPDGETTAGGQTASVAAGDDADRPRSRRRRKRKKNRLPILAGMMVVPLLLLGLAIALRGRGPQRRERPRPTAEVTRNVPAVRESRREPAPSPQPTTVNGFEIVDSDRLLWVPPYAADSKAPPLSLLPPGPAAIVSVPLADVFSSPDARPLLSTFETELEPLVQAAIERAGVKRERIARCTAALFPGQDGWPEVALSIELTEPLELGELTEAWEAFPSPLEGGRYMHVGEDIEGDAYFIGDQTEGKPSDDTPVRRFAVGSVEQIREIGELGGAPIPLVRTMQTLWDAASSESDLVVAVTPNFLFADGRQMLASAAPQFTPLLKRWLIPEVSAMSLSASAADGALYLELRQLPSGGQTTATLLKSFRESQQRWPEWADEFILRSVPDPSWRLLAMRLPLMLRFVSEQVRSTIDGETVVASTYLPVDAGAQVALGTLLAMNTPAGESVVADAATQKALSVEEQLNHPMSISFLQLSLQFAVDAVVEEFEQTLPPGSTMPAVRIIGGDLELNGITQNQQIRGFERQNEPLRKILTELVLGANPDETASGPGDPKQSLVWVVHPKDAPPEEAEILITTRDAAQDKYELPPEFQLDE